MIVLYDCMTNTTWSWWSSLPLHISRVKMSPFGCHLTNTYLPPYIQNVSFYRCTCVCKGKLTFFSFFNIFFAPKDFEPAFWPIWQLHQSKNLKTILTIIPLSVPNWASAEEQFSPNYPPPDHNLGQILNSDPASSYFPLKFADLLKLKYFLHPWQPVILYYTITTIKANRDNSSYRINSLDLLYL